MDYKNLLCASVFSLCAVYGASNVHADDNSSHSEPLSVNAEDIHAVYDRIRPTSFISSPEDQCVAARFLEESLNQNFAQKAEALFSIFELTKITRNLKDDFITSDGALCFVDFEEEYGNSTAALNFAMYSPQYVLIIINDNENVDEGCQVSAMAHEFQHNTQALHGLTFPVRDLTIHDQDDLVVTMEADAHAIQLTASAMLAEKGYGGAKACNDDLFAKEMPRFAEATAVLNDVLENDASALHDGRAASDVYQSFINNKRLFMTYGDNARMMYDCFSFPTHCYRQHHSLDDLNIDLSVLRNIHFPSNYDPVPFSQVKEAVLALEQ